MVNTPSKASKEQAECNSPQADTAHTPESVARLDKATVFDETTSTTASEIQDRDKSGIKKGSILRWKYRRTEGCFWESSEYGGEPPPAKRQRLEPNAVGWHPKNRNGKPPQPSRCEQLTAELMGKYDTEQGDHNAVAIEENPKTPTRFLDHTKQVCAAHDRLANPTNTYMTAASVGHSHLNQLLRNVLNAALSTSPGLARVRDADGKLQIKMLAAHDERMANHAKRGLAWEILSYKLEEEEPSDGVACVQLTLNDTQAVAMAKYEMQAVAHMEEVILTREASLWGSRASGSGATVQLKLEQENIWREQVANAGFAELALSEDFEGVLNLVVSTCNGPWLKKMLQWHSDWINSQQRRISYATLAGFSWIPLDKPRSRHALFAKAWDKKGRQTGAFCNTVSGTLLKSLAQPKYAKVLEDTENLLLKVQEEYKTLGAYADLPDKELKNLMLNIDVVVGGALLAPNVERQRKNFEVCKREVQELLKKFLSPKGLSMISEASLMISETISNSAQAGAASSMSAEVPGPAIIGYDTQGNPTQKTQPTAMKQTQEPITLHWNQTLDNFDEDIAQRVNIHAACHAAQTLLADQSHLILLAGRADGKGICKVTAKRDIGAYELMLLPLPYDLNQISKKRYTGNPPGHKVCIMGTLSVTQVICPI